jgi:nanoRNase/pAp phosphatase (c-di-AMP/oligoRNAs hydrolase)
MSIPNEEFNKVKGGIKKADKILVCSSNKASLDTYSAMAALILYLQDINKPVTVAIDGKLPERYAEIFNDVDIEYKTSIEPPSYIVSIDHSGGEIDKVSYDDKDGKFNLYITPSGSGKNFDFENIDFKAGGGNYDLVIVFGVRSLNWIGSLYRKNKSVFDDKAVVNINNLKGAQDYGKVKLVDTEISVGEIVHKLLDGKSTSSSEDIYQLLLLGIIDYLQPMQMNDYKISTVETMTAAVKFGADLKEAFQKLYYKRSFEYFSVVQRLFSNLKVDKNSGLAWAGLSAFDISQTGIAKDDIPLNGRIPFNVCEDFRVAFIFYGCMMMKSGLSLRSTERI